MFPIDDDFEKQDSKLTELDFIYKQILQEEREITEREFDKYDDPDIDWETEQVFPVKPNNFAKNNLLKKKGNVMKTVTPTMKWIIFLVTVIGVIQILACVSLYFWVIFSQH